jgi:hypothetical protein
MKALAQYIDLNGMNNRNTIKYLYPTGIKKGETQMVSRIDDTSPTLDRMPGISIRRLLQEPSDVDLLVNLGNDIEGLPVNPIQFLVHLLHVLLIESAMVGFRSVLLYRLPPNA